MKVNNWFTKRDHCPVCNSQAITQLFKSPYSGPEISNYLEIFYKNKGNIDFSYLHDVDYTLCKCLICDLIFQLNIPSDDLMVILYDKWLDPLKVFNSIDGVNDVEYFLDYSKQIANVIKYFNKKPQELTFLDFGMGWGHWCRVAKSFDCKAYGHELSVSRIQYAQKEGLNVVSYDDISQMKFDFINTDQVFEHIATPFEVLKYLKMSLKPEGVIRIYVPNGSRTISKIMKLKMGSIQLEKVNEIAPLEHINCFGYKSLIEMGKRAGLREVIINPTYSNTFGDLLDEKIRQPLFRSIGKRRTDIYFTQCGQGNGRP